ncbi:hypothetical protein Tco_0110933 [Tanacetum coccineum]
MINNHSYGRKETDHSIRSNINNHIEKKSNRSSGTATTLLLKLISYQCRSLIILEEITQMSSGTATTRLSQLKQKVSIFGQRQLFKVSVTSDKTKFRKVENDLHQLEVEYQPLKIRRNPHIDLCATVSRGGVNCLMKSTLTHLWEHFGLPLGLEQGIFNTTHFMNSSDSHMPKWDVKIAHPPIN